MTEPVADLATYRERRTVRRIAAVTVLGVVMYAALVRLRETWETVEYAIRWTAEQLPQENR